MATAVESIGGREIPNEGLAKSGLQLRIWHPKGFGKPKTDSKNQD
jgi:hypothetical protein